MVDMGPEKDNLDDEWRELARSMNDDYHPDRPHIEPSGPRDWSAYVPTEDEEIEDVDEILNATYDAQEPHVLEPAEVGMLTIIVIAVLAIVANAFSFIHLSTTIVILLVFVAVGAGVAWFTMYATSDDDDDGIRL